ncbi:MAG: flavin reductase [Myxococcales bacterium]|nr:flavin reductase [Myxococcales bacterium]
MDPTRFKSALGHFLSGVTVVTAEVVDASGGMELLGMTASAFLSVSVDPPLVLVSVAKTARLHAALLGRGGEVAAPARFAISVLAAGQDQVSNHFAGWKDPTFEPGVDRGRFRTPVITGALVWLDLDLHDAVDAGDHTLLIGRVVDLGLAAPPPSGGAPLAYYRGKYGGFIAK